MKRSKDKNNLKCVAYGLILNVSSMNYKADNNIKYIRQFTLLTVTLINYIFWTQMVILNKVNVGKKVSKERPSTSLFVAFNSLRS